MKWYYSVLQPYLVEEAEMTLSKGRLPYSKEWKACFAWFPTYLLNGDLVWLETIYYRWDGSGYDPDFEYSRYNLENVFMKEKHNA